MLINYVPGEECRIAIVEDGRLEEIYHERADNESHVGNIYKGKVLNVEPGIQAAFVDFGLERNGFLHVSDLHPKYFPGDLKEETERVGHKTPRRERPPIQHCLRRGQEVLVQVIKEGIGTKGPTLTSYLSIPGRYLVMMPDMERHGVSRKVEDDETRREMKKVLDELNPPEGFGFIVRTAGLGRPKAEIKRDLAYLQRLWKAIDRRMNSTLRVGELYTESDLIIRTIRDVFTGDVDRIVVDDLDAARRARDFLAIANPRSGSKVVVYSDLTPIFHRYGLERQLEGIHHRRVLMNSGGSLVIDSTEALVAIDVNSGKMRDHSDAETTALRTNMEAADEVCRQLRLRDLGGVVVVDFIDMALQKNRKAVESRFRENLKRDRARTRVNPISQFGLLEMTRQRMRPSLKKSVTNECLACAGLGYVTRPETVVLDVLRQLAMVMHHPAVHRLDLVVSPDVAFHLLNRKRGELVGLEKRTGKAVLVRVGGQRIDHIELVAYDERNGVVDYGRLRDMGEPTLVPVDDALSQAGHAPTADLFDDEPDLAYEDDPETPSGESPAPAVDGQRDADAPPAPRAAMDADEPRDAGQASQQADGDAEEAGGRRRRRKRRRRGRGGDFEGEAQGPAPMPAEGPPSSAPRVAPVANPVARPATKPASTPGQRPLPPARPLPEPTGDRPRWHQAAQFRGGPGAGPGDDERPLGPGTPGTRGTDSGPADAYAGEPAATHPGSGEPPEPGEAAGEMEQGGGRRRRRRRRGRRGGGAGMAGDPQVGPATQQPEGQAGGSSAGFGPQADAESDDDSDGPQAGPGGSVAMPSGAAKEPHAVDGQAEGAAGARRPRRRRGRRGRGGGGGEGLAEGSQAVIGGPGTGEFAAQAKPVAPVPAAPSVEVRAIPAMVSEFAAGAVAVPPRDYRGGGVRGRVAGPKPVRPKRPVYPRKPPAGSVVIDASATQPAPPVGPVGSQAAPESGATQP